MWISQIPDFELPADPWAERTLVHLKIAGERVPVLSAYHFVDAFTHWAWQRLQWIEQHEPGANTRSVLGMLLKSARKSAVCVGCNPAYLLWRVIDDSGNRHDLPEAVERLRQAKHFRDRILDAERELRSSYQQYLKYRKTLR